MSHAIRVLGFIVLAAAAVAAFVLLAPTAPKDVPTLPSTVQYLSLISQALEDGETNEANADTAPKQQVVNGWVARDLLTIIAKEQADLLLAQGAIVDSNGILRAQPFDERVPALIVIGILAVCWAGVSAARPGLAQARLSALAPAPTIPPWVGPPGQPLE